MYKSTVQATFGLGWLTGHIIDDVSDFGDTNDLQSIPEHMVTVQCFSLHSLLLAINQTSVDYFSLDIEGHELQVLKNIPWKIIDIKVIYNIYSYTSIISKNTN